MGVSKSLCLSQENEGKNGFSVGAVYLSTLRVKTVFRSEFMNKYDVYRHHRHIDKERSPATLGKACMRNVY